MRALAVVTLEGRCRTADTDSLQTDYDAVWKAQKAVAKLAKDKSARTDSTSIPDEPLPHEGIADRLSRPALRDDDMGRPVHRAPEACA